MAEALSGTGTPGEITFEVPDAILAFETVDGRAGFGLWTREELGRYPLLHLDKIGWATRKAPAAPAPVPSVAAGGGD